MNVTEYALLDDKGEITGVVMTNRTQHDVQAGYGQQCQVVPLSQVPLEVKRRYEFWDNRP